MVYGNEDTNFNWVEG